MGAPIGPVQAPPMGFLGALDIKSVGRTPDEIEGMYTPTIEMREWLLTQRRTVRGAYREIPENTGPESILFSSGQELLQIPNDEVWYVWNLSVGMQASATGGGGPNYVVSGTYGPSIQLIDGTTSVIQPCAPLLLAPTEQYAGITASTQQNFWAHGCEPRRWFQPTTTFGFNLGRYITGADTILGLSVFVEYTPAKV